MFHFFKWSFSGYWRWPSPLCRLGQVRKQLWRCENDARHPLCSSMMYHGEIYIEQRYEILTMPPYTQLWDSIWDTEQSIGLVEPGLQLWAFTGSFLSSPSHSIEKLPHMTFFLVWGCGKQAQTTRLHFTCQAVCESSGGGKSRSRGSRVSQSASNGGDRASGGHSWYGEYVEPRWILGEHGMTRVQHRLP